MPFGSLSSIQTKQLKLSKTLNCTDKVWFIIFFGSLKRMFASTLKIVLLYHSMISTYGPVLVVAAKS